MTVASAEELLEDFYSNESEQTDEAKEVSVRIDSAVDKIRLSYQGARVVIGGLSNRRSVNAQEKQKAADLFNADSTSLSVSSLLWDKTEVAVRKLRSEIYALQRIFHSRRWTLPTTTPGLRLVKKDCLVSFREELATQTKEIEKAAAALKAQLPDIVQRERKRQGNLFKEENYNFDPVSACVVSWSFPSVLEDDELAELDPAVYQEEIRRVREEFRETVRIAESEMVESLYGSLSKLAERLETDSSGKKKIFRADTVNKLFEELDYISEQLSTNGLGGDALQQAAKSLRGILGGESAETMAAALRQDDTFRMHMQQECVDLADKLIQTAVPAQRRRILVNSASQV